MGLLKFPEPKVQEITYGEKSKIYYFSIYEDGIFVLSSFCRMEKEADVVMYIKELYGDNVEFYVSDFYGRRLINV